MLTRLIERRLASEERRLGAGTLDYLRVLWRASRPAFWAFASAGRFLRFRGRLPAPVHHVARVAATRAEDCGTCLQITIRAARAAGVDPAVLRAVLQGQADQLPPLLARVAAYAEAVVRADDTTAAALRPQLEAELGRGGLAELAVAVAAARVFPTTKRALGLAVSCARVDVSV